MFRHDVSGRKAQALTPAVSPYYDPGNGICPAQQPCCVLHISFFKETTDLRAAYHFAVQRDLLDFPHRETEFLPELFQGPDITLPALSKLVVEAHENLLCS